MPYRLAATLSALALTLPLAAQTKPISKPVARPASAALKPYISCKLPAGPDLAGTTPLPEVPMTRAAQTLTGPKKIRIADGLFAAYSFTPGVPFVNVKVEQLPAATYTSEKADLISEFDAINAKGENTQRNYDLKPTLNGFEINGFDRTVISPLDKVLGIYVFFDNARHVATTAYFLNGAAGQRRFNNITEYNGLRDGFLNAYTLCVRRELGGAPAAAPAKKPAAKQAAKPAARRRR